MGQRELWSGISLQVGYVGTLVKGQQGFININAGAPGTGDAGRPLIGFGINADITEIRPYKDAIYHALQSELRGRTRYAQFGVAYTWSKAINYADNDGGPRVQYLPFAELNRGVAGFDRTHNLQPWWVWDLPFGKDRALFNSGILKAILGGWQVNGIASITSGSPINITQGTAPNPLARGSGQSPNQVKDVVEIFPDNLKRAPAGGQTDPNASKYQYFDRSAFAAETGARFGNVARNSLRGPGFFNLDMGLFRTFGLPGEVRLQVRAEAVNVLNHASFNNPNGNFNDGNFGFITGQANSPRTLRFGARLSF
jgi:hypothetical protein